MLPGKHGIHVHEKGDTSDHCAAAGGHFNPYKQKHGGPDSKERHVGDLGNILADSNGLADFEIQIPKGTSLIGKNSIVGHTLIIHAKEDVYTVQPTGGAGARLVCGIIKSKRQFIINNVSLGCLFLNLYNESIFRFRYCWTPNK